MGTSATTTTVDPLSSAYDMMELLLLDSDIDDLPGKLVINTKNMTQNFANNKLQDSLLQFVLELFH